MHQTTIIFTNSTGNNISWHIIWDNIREQIRQALINEDIADANTLTTQITIELAGGKPEYGQLTPGKHQFIIKSRSTTVIKTVSIKRNIIERKIATQPSNLDQPPSRPHPQPSPQQILDESERLIRQSALEESAATSFGIRLNREQQVIIANLRIQGYAFTQGILFNTPQQYQSHAGIKDIIKIINMKTAPYNSTESSNTNITTIGDDLKLLMIYKTLFTQYTNITRRKSIKDSNLSTWYINKFIESVLFIMKSLKISNPTRFFLEKILILYHNKYPQLMPASSECWDFFKNQNWMGTIQNLFSFTTNTPQAPIFFQTQQE